MTRLTRLLHRGICTFIGSHDIDWIYVGLTGTRRCIHCEHPMPLTVRDTHPDQGD